MPVPARLRSLPLAALVAAALGVPAAPAQVPSPPPSPSPAAARTEGVGAEPIRTTRLRGVSARVAALMMSGQRGGPIPISVLALPVAVADRVRVFFAADIEGTNLLAGQATQTVQVETCAYAISSQGAVGGSVAQAFTLDLDRAVELLSNAGIKLLGSLDVPPGTYALRVMVRNVQVGSFGITEVPAGTPPAEGTPAFLSPLLVGEPAALWVLAREAGDADAGAPLHPFRFLPEGTVPSTRPVLAAGSVAGAWVLLRGAVPGAASLPIKVIGPERNEVARVDATVLERRDSGVAGASALRLAIPVPNLPTGPYLFELSATPMAPDVVLASSTAVLVADKKAAQAQQVWVQFGTPREDETAPARAAFAGKAGRAKVSAKLVAGYRAALARVRTGSEAEALASLAELEGGALPHGGAAEWETLVSSEKQVAEELAKARPAAALALAYLHGELYREYMSGRAFLLAAHGRRMIEDLAVLYSERAGKEARPTAAHVLAALAGAMQQPGMVGASERLFRRALELDPANRAALMGLGAGLERVGQYKLAAGFLARIVDADPSDAEARLRLGVNLGRLGEERKAAELLKRCTAEGNPLWVRVVAYQETAAGLVRAGRFEEAHRVLTEAIASVPGDEALTVAQAYVLDRLRRPLEARAVVDGLKPEREGASDTPRFRYSQWPADDLAISRKAVAEAGRQALGPLGDALAAGGGR